LYDAAFAYGKLDLEHGRGVVSLARMRDLVGRPTSIDTTLDGLRALLTDFVVGAAPLCERHQSELNSRLSERSASK
jgi:hypothetical protein